MEQHLVRSEKIKVSNIPPVRLRDLQVDFIFPLDIPYGDVDFGRYIKG